MRPFGKVSTERGAYSGGGNRKEEDAIDDGGPGGPAARRAGRVPVKDIPAATVARHRLEVSEAMTVDFEQSQPGLGKLHPVYATYWLAKHFELVSRKLTLPYLEEHEQGIGFELSVRHLAPALPGTEVELEAELLRVDGNRLYCRCRATARGELIGEGSTTQVILPRSELKRRFASLRERSS